MKVRYICCVWFTILGCLVYGVSGQRSPTDSPHECETWTQLTNGINQYHRGQGNIACKDHSRDKCEQLDCGGSYILEFIQMQFNVCLGLVFHHCDSPPSIELSLQIPTFNASIHRLVIHNDTIPVPGLSRNIGQNRAEIVLFVELQRWNRTSFLLKMSGRVRLTTTVFGREITDWPEHLQQDIITMSIPVTNCTTRTRTTLSPLKPCDVQQYIGTSSPFTAVVTTPSPPIKITSVTYNKTCLPGSMRRSQCGYGEACINSRCLCAYDYQLSTYGVCQIIGKKQAGPILNGFPSIPGLPMLASQQQSTSSSGSNKTKLAMIIGGSVGGLVALVAVIIVVVMVIRKRGARYQGRELLLTEDDTDGAI
ncbi:uncharacterized protein LOC110455613 isoform X1 [Mizuhopecten yessoensis]|nr:uncharacterized protein LOC110455613 isoform X1 [Mizuhopecten yessoensis]